MSSETINGNSGTHAGSDSGFDYTLCECELQPLEELVSRLEGLHSVTVRKAPSICLTMLPAEDSLEGQKFYLGEALTTECEVTVDGMGGFGLCLGDEPARAYSIAVVDALLHGGQPIPSEIDSFLREQGEKVARRDRDEVNLILQTHVDFKLMEEA